MATLYVTHPAFANHLVPEGFPERPARLKAVDEALSGEAFHALTRAQAPMGDVALATLAHSERYVAGLEAKRPTEGLVALDSDTFLSPGSWEAALRALGGATLAVDQVIAGKAKNAFVAVRPPGHHAEPERAMGFCLFDTVAIAARHARKTHGIGRVAIVDFDVHHGNGTQKIFWEDGAVFYASTHQMPLFPGTGKRDERGVGNILNVPVKAGDGGDVFRPAYRDEIIPALKAFKPDLLLISAGFDAHKNDPLAGCKLVEDDFGWITSELLAAADEICGGHVVSVLEGGYDLKALGGSAAAHVGTLMKA